MSRCLFFVSFVYCSFFVCFSHYKMLFVCTKFACCLFVFGFFDVDGVFGVSFITELV